jgi:hypothetical protein
MDCKSGVATVGVFGAADAGAEGTTGVGAALDAADDDTAEEGSLGEGAEDTATEEVTDLVPMELTTSPRIGVFAAATAALGEVILGDLADKGLSSSSSGGGLTLVTLGEEATGVLVLEEMGMSSSSLGAVALTGANLGEVALRGDFAWSPFMRKYSGRWDDWQRQGEKYLSWSLHERVSFLSERYYFRLQDY